MSKKWGPKSTAGKVFMGIWGGAALSLMIYFLDPEGSEWWRFIFIVPLVHYIGARIACWIDEIVGEQRIYKGHPGAHTTASRTWSRVVFSSPLWLKRRLRASSMPEMISVHSFHVLVVTDQLSQNVLLEDIQHRADHACPRSTLKSMYRPEKEGEVGPCLLQFG